MNIPPHIKAVIFDLDGLLIDSEPVWEKAGDVFLGKYGHKHDPAIGDIRGMGLRDIVLLWQKELGLQGETTSLLQELRSEFYTLALEQKQLQLLPGVEKTIRYFEGKKRAIATGGHKKKQIKILLANFGLHPYFDDVISSDDVSKGKPDPEVYLFTASRLGILPEECLVLEDSVNGVKSGKAAGMTVYGINKDPEIYKKLKDAGADKVFKNLHEIQII